MQREKIRLQKYLSECEVASRRKAEELIINGNVKVNGRKAILGDKIDPYKDLVTVKGKRVSRVEEKVYLMLNKPRGFITTMSDDRGRKCVADLIKDVKQKVYPIGRLDKDSEGLLLLTNDGNFSNTMMHTKTHVPKTYRVTVREKVEAEKIELLKKGVIIDDRKTAPCEIEILQQEENRTVLLFVLYEGRNREIRKMCQTVNYNVIRLKRIAFGNLKLGMLKIGKWRYLHENEVAKLIALASKTKY